jgi:hypothetical protein
MRLPLLTLGLVLAAAAPAVAAPPAKLAAGMSEAVAAIVRRHVASHELDPAIGVVLLPGGDAPGKDASFRDNILPGPQGETDAALTDVAAWRDDPHGVGWFQGPFEASSMFAGHSQTLERHFHYRISGVTVDDKLVAVMYGNVVPDRELRAEPAAPAGPPAVPGDTALANEVKVWFATGFASHAATGDRIVASGTAPAEFRTGRAAVELAGGADRLHPRPLRIDAQLLGRDHAVGFVRVLAELPLKKAGEAIPLLVGVVVVRDGAAWRWVSLQFAWAGAAEGD